MGEVASPTTLFLVVKLYSQERGISFPNKLTAALVGQHNPSGDYTFYIQDKGAVIDTYSYPRRDMACYSRNRSLRIPRSDRALLINNPAARAFIADWVNRNANVDLNEEDISKVLVGQSHVDVIINPDSMRFKNHFTLDFL